MNNARGFTVVELMIATVVITILATISVVAWRGWQNSVHQDVLRSDLLAASSQLDNDLMWNDEYPTSEAAANGGQGLPKSEGTTYDYARISDSQYCLEASSGRSGVAVHHIFSDGEVKEGECPFIPVDGIHIQLIDSGNCIENRIRAVDARDNKTYWVQKMPDGKCWMLTNLAYAGGGSNTYGDVKSIINGSSDTSGTTFTEPKYYVSAGANATIEPTNPSTSNTGNGQYGYHYNWCAAMGAQTSTSACASSDTPAPSLSVSICPSGWRLPTGGSDGEFAALLAALGVSNNTNGSITLHREWLAQRGGYWNYGAANFETYGYYWGSTQSSASYASYLSFSSSYVGVSLATKGLGHSVRCVAI